MTRARPQHLPRLGRDRVEVDTVTLSSELAATTYTVTLKSEHDQTQDGLGNDLAAYGATVMLTIP